MEAEKGCVITRTRVIESQESVLYFGVLYWFGYLETFTSSTWPKETGSGELAAFSLVK